MTATARATAYLRQTGRPVMTATQARRYRKKIFRGDRTAATASVMDAVDGLPGASAVTPRGGGPASPAVQRGRTGGDGQPLRPGT